MNKNELEKIILNQLNEKFDIVGKIGEGLHSTVYRTAESALKIKTVIFSDNGSNQKRLDYARNEVDVMQKLKDCPHTVKYEGGSFEKLIINNRQVGGIFVIKMPFLDCLSDMIKNNRFILSEGNILKTARHICTALCEMHRKGIVHRDIKPDNFFCDYSGNFMLGDFSISGYADGNMSRAGTVRYIAPEVFTCGKNINYFQADIYSLGISLYELTNNCCIPLENECGNAEKAVEMRTRGRFFSAPENATAEFAEIIRKACAYDMNERYKSADRMLEDLCNINRLSVADYTDSDSIFY